MRIVWVTRTFLDYRVPVYKELYIKNKRDFYLLFSEEENPNSVNNKVYNELQGNAIGFSGELWLGKKDNVSGIANKALRIPWQPGLIKKIRSLKPDVLVADGFFQWTYAALWVRIFWRIPLVMCYERNAYVERSAQWYRIWYRKFTIQFINAICCTGKLCKDYILSYGYKKPITMGHMVADVNNLQESVKRVSGSQINLLRQQLYIKGTFLLYVGILDQRKGIIQLLEAWNASDVMKKGDITLVMVGNGSKSELYKEYCADNDITNVLFTGRINYDQLPPYYAAADIFINPTLEDNWSLVVPEAMACGLPVITTIYNGCWPELVTSENGWVFDPLQPDEFVQTLERSFASRDKFKEMGKKSLEIIANHTPYVAASAVYEACLQVVKS